MRTISMHYKNNANCQKKRKPATNALCDTVIKGGSCHTLLKKLNAYETKPVPEHVQ